jgi:hypothetical protein
LRQKSVFGISYHFTLKKGKRHYATLAEATPGDVSIRDKGGIPKIIQRLQADQAEVSVGSI